MERPLMSRDEVRTLTSDWMKQVDQIAEDAGLDGFGKAMILLKFAAIEEVLVNGLTPDNAVEYAEEQIRKFAEMNPPNPSAKSKPVTRQRRGKHAP